MTDAPSNIVAALARVHVDDLDAALPLYRELTGDEPHTFGFRDIRLATVGAFLLIEGGDEQVRSRTATVIVRDIAVVERTVADLGGTVLEGPAPAPNGPRLIARHPDGAVFEYIQYD
ncbi:hypothetical protein J8M97_13650 [Gordonia polyisoprenivorans]|uniref:VOC family protein n=1 Tax=Gordonia polyisoprenivorans TaxID=84595 RepID=UPI000374C5EE|nr:hypothetical protein [Gordonia polyisoprenivorans]QUD80909.1 hypothetical protein J8M97_13650 [Gordonia polyisoprenivorans]